MRRSTSCAARSARAGNATGRVGALAGGRLLPVGRFGLLVLARRRAATVALRLVARSVAVLLLARLRRARLRCCGGPLRRLRRMRLRCRGGPFRGLRGRRSLALRTRWRSAVRGRTGVARLRGRRPCHRRCTSLGARISRLRRLRRLHARVGLRRTRLLRIGRPRLRIRRRVGSWGGGRRTRRLLLRRRWRRRARGLLVRRRWRRRPRRTRCRGRRRAHRLPRLILPLHLASRGS